MGINFVLINCSIIVGGGGDDDVDDSCLNTHVNVICTLFISE